METPTPAYLIESRGGPQRVAKLCNMHRVSVYRWKVGIIPMPLAIYRFLMAQPVVPEFAALMEH